MTDKEEEAHSASLVKRIIQGDSKAEQAMVERYQAGLSFILSQWSRDKEQIDDVFQETWRIVIEKVRAGKLKDNKKLAGYIIKTGKFQLIMSHRKIKKHTFISDEDSKLVSDIHHQPQSILERHKTSTLVRKLIDTLSTPRDRELLYRFYLAENNKDKLCEEYNLSELHFNRVLHRARQRFKKVWDEYAKTKNV